MSDAALELRNVFKSHPGPAGAAELAVLRGVNFTLAAGGSVAIVGPSGSGKSTLLNLMGALDRPTSGEVIVGGRNPAGLSERELAQMRNRAVGFVFQQHHLLPQLDALENVLVPALATHAKATADEVARARGLLARVGLGDRAHHRPSEMSGGECQRVAVARALINRPGLVLADEPTGSLDAATADEVARLLVEVNRAEGAALVVVTHSARLARRMDRALALSDGGLTEWHPETATTPTPP